MDKCEYKEVCDNSESGIKINKSTDRILFLKQLLICSGVWTSHFTFGLCVGAPTVFIPQIRKEANNTNVITDDMASWLSSVYSFSGFPFILIISIITRYIGRKIPYLIANLDMFLANLGLYFSTNVTHILICELMYGFFIASQIVIVITIVPEYTSPKYRGFFLTMKAVSFSWGVWVSNAIGTFFHWKMIPLFCVVCTLYNLVTILVWPESPYWLASRGKYKACAESHRWLKGCDEESEKELQALINAQKEYIASCDTKKISKSGRVKDFFKTVKSVEFYKPTLLSILCGNLALFSGKVVLLVYAIDILKKITINESLAYAAMLILDGVTVLSMYGGCVLSKYLKRRTLLLVSAAVGVILLYILSLYLYLITLNIITDNRYISLSLLIGFSIAISCGPLSIAGCISGELIPVRSRNISVCILALSIKLFNSVVLKLFPLVFKYIRVHGAFFCFGFTSNIFILILYKYLPETKDKTLQKITESMKCEKNNVNAATNLLRDIM